MGIAFSKEQPFKAKEFRVIKLIYIDSHRAKYRFFSFFDKPIYYFDKLVNKSEGETFFLTVIAQKGFRVKEKFISPKHFGNNLYYRVETGNSITYSIRTNANIDKFELNYSIEPERFEGLYLVLSFFIYTILGAFFVLIYSNLFNKIEIVQIFKMHIMPLTTVVLGGILAGGLGFLAFASNQLTHKLKVLFLIAMVVFVLFILYFE